MNDDLDAWLDEMADVPPGDFADVLRRAQQLPGANVSDQDIEEAEALPRDEDELRARLAFGTLDDFLDDAAAFVAAQGHEAPPPMRALQVEARPNGRRGWAWGVAGLAAAAAIAALWVALPSGLLGTQDDGRSQSAAADRATPIEGSQAVDPPPRLEPRPAPPEPELLVDPEAELLVDPEPEALEGDTDAEAPQHTTPRSTVAELDAMARDAWRAGDLGRARRLFERVVARGGRGERADIAYGDLFTLARRQGDDAGLRRYWKRYVGRFPSGRYIDDARAGLCRAASGEARTRCWEAYLKARPQGTFRADAEAALQTP